MNYQAKNLFINKFRKLNNVNIELGKKITVISGHNGVGKSNILSLIASGSGTKKYKTHDNKSFHPQFEDYFKIYRDELVEDYNCYITYTYNDQTQQNYEFTKRMSLKDDTDENRGIRIIPRTHNYYNLAKTILETEKEVKHITGTGPSARIDMPTIFLSLSRLYPLGEGEASTNDIDVRSSIISKKGNDKYREWYNYVLPGSISDDEKEMKIIEKEITSKSSFYMPLKNTNPLSQSIGQDNLGNIISVLVDYYNISKEKDYFGGLLCIDEIDVSLHPNAQLNLLKLLNRLSDELNLQIIISSHSLTIIKELLRLKTKKPDDYNLVYLKNSTSPFPTQYLNYDMLKADLFQEQNYRRPKVKIYFEDDTSSKLFELLIEIGKRIFPDYKFPIYQVIQTYLGCRALTQLVEKDVYFKTVGIILDGDSRLSTNAPKVIEHLEDDEYIKGLNTMKHPYNIVYLPNYFAPESFLYRIIHQYVVNEKEHEKFWRSLDIDPDTTLFTPEYTKNHILMTKEIYTNDDIKNKADTIFEFTEKSDILFDYYSNNDNQKEIKLLMDDTLRSLEILSKKLLATRF